MFPVDKCLEATHSCLIIQRKDIFCLNRHMTLICVCLKNNDLKGEGKKFRIIEKNHMKQLQLVKRITHTHSLKTFFFSLFEIGSHAAQAGHELETDLKLRTLLPSFISQVLALQVRTTDHGLNLLNFNMSSKFTSRVSGVDAFYTSVGRSCHMTQCTSFIFGSYICLTRVEVKRPLSC